VQQQLPPSQRSKPNPAPKRVQGRQGHYAAAAAAAAVMFACSVAAAHAAQQVAASYSLGTWSTAALSVARHMACSHIAAESRSRDLRWWRQYVLPCLSIVSCCACVAWLGNRMLEWAEVWFADCVCKSHALRSGQRLLQRCGHLQRDVWSLEHCSSQRSSICSCSHIAAESRSRDLRWWLRLYVLPC